MVATRTGEATNGRVAGRSSSGAPEASSSDERKHKKQRIDPPAAQQDVAESPEPEMLEDPASPVQSDAPATRAQPDAPVAVDGAGPSLISSPAVRSTPLPAPISGSKSSDAPASQPTALPTSPALSAATQQPAAGQIPPAAPKQAQTAEQKAADAAEKARMTLTARLVMASKQRARDRLRLCDSCLRLDAQRAAVKNMLEALAQGESNSALLLGPPGSGKTAVFEAALRDVRPAEFHTVKLSSVIHSSDKIALRELVRQLVSCGALEELYASQIQLDDDEEQEQNEEDAEDDADDLDGDGGSDDEDSAQAQMQSSRAKAKAARIEAAKAAAESAMLSSIAMITTHLLSLLTTQSKQQAASQKPIIVVLENMDDFALRPKQALLYVLLDAVQSSSYRPGLLVLATATRLDTVDLLEKRVKSRFSQRVIHCRPSETLECWLEKALHPLLDEVDAAKTPIGLVPIDWVPWAAKWNQAWKDALAAPNVVRLLQHEWELENNIASLYQTWLSLVASLTASAPLPTALSVQRALQARHRDAQLHVLLSLTRAETALLVAAMHISVSRDRKVFTFEMLRNEVERGLLKGARQLARDVGRAAAGAGALQKPQAQIGVHDRAGYLKAYRRLLSYALLLPETVNTSLSVPTALRKPWVSALPGQTSADSSSGSAGAGAGGLPLEFLKVRLSVPAPMIVQAVQSKDRREPLQDDIVRWCLHKGD